MIKFIENANRNTFDKLVQTQKRRDLSPSPEDQMVTLVHNGLMPES